MGLNAECEFTIDGVRGSGEAHLDTSELRLRGAARITIPFDRIVAFEARAGQLFITHKDGEASIRLGKAAEAWALKLRYPKGRTEKLGVKAGNRVAVVGIKDAAFLKELEAAGAKVALKPGKGPYEIVLVRLDQSSDLPRLTDARQRIVPSGMVWAIWPKGRKEFREDDIRRFGPQAKLVDVKVMSFSEELSGLKLVIPVALR